MTGQPTRFVSKVDSDETVPKESISGPDIDAYAPEWPLLIRILNSASYFVDDSILELGNEILEKEGTGKNLTTWEQWLLNTGFDAKKEGFGDQVKEQLQRWGGRVFI